MAGGAHGLIRNTVQEPRASNDSNEDELVSEKPVMREETHFDKTDSGRISDF